MLTRVIVGCLLSLPGAGRAQTASGTAAPAQAGQAGAMAPGSMQVEAGPWRELLVKIIKHGADQTEYVELNDVRGDERGDHTAGVISVWGEPSGAGGMSAYKVEIVHEDYKIGANGVGSGNFYIDQWTFTLNMDGTLNRYSHGFLIEDLNRDHPRLGSLPPTGARAMLQSLLSGWYRYKPQGR